jgi:hypothetical protein
MASLSSFDATQSAMLSEKINCSSESETEDEEITMTCTGGLQGASFETDESDESQTDLSSAEGVDEE